MKKRLTISTQRLEKINKFLISDHNPIIDNLVDIVEKYGGVKEINRKAHESRRIENLLNRLENTTSPFLNDLIWLQEQRDDKNFISLDEYKEKILGEKTGSVEFDESLAVTLEISACNFFPFLVEEAKIAIENENLMPSRYIRVRSMKEQVMDGDITAFTAATAIIGATYVQTLDIKGTLLGGGR